MRILTRDDIRACATVASLVPCITGCMKLVSTTGATDMPLRTSVALGDGRRFGIMHGRMAASIAAEGSSAPGEAAEQAASVVAPPPVHGAKMLSLYPDNPKYATGCQ